MKDKTHAMNRGVSAEDAERGFEKLSDSEIQTSRDRKNRQLNWANLEDNVAMKYFENMDGADEDFDVGFMPRNNYEDRN